MAVRYLIAGARARSRCPAVDVAVPAAIADQADSTTQLLVINVCPLPARWAAGLRLKVAVFFAYLYALDCSGL